MFDQIAKSIPYQCIEYLGTEIWFKRLDRVHPQISGNKFFKLKYNFLQAKKEQKKRIVTFGGAYSNHIAATAYAAQLFGFESIGFIRGEELQYKALNPTLETARSMGMQLEFIDRARYRDKHLDVFLAQLERQFPNSYIIPEGGSNALAIQGCQEILTLNDQHYDVICTPVGTGGTIAGLIEASLPHQLVLGFSALKGQFLCEEVSKLSSKRNWQIMDDYCCGGYAKTNSELIQFMYDFEAQYQIPLEQIYTAKMLFGVFDLIRKQYFKAKQKILVIHTGGLQGRSF